MYRKMIIIVSIMFILFQVIITYADDYFNINKTDYTQYVNMIQDANNVYGCGIRKTILMRYPLGRIGLWSVNQGEIVDFITRGVILYPSIDTIVKKERLEDWRGNFTGDPSKMTITYKTNTAAKGSSVDLTVTPNISIYRYHFSSASKYKSVVILVNELGIDASTKWDNNNFSVIDNQTIQVTISNSRTKIYFYLRFSEPFTGYGTINGSKMNEEINSITGDDIGGYVKYGITTKEVVVGVSISHTSMNKAITNFSNEFSEMDFDKAVTNLKNAWKVTLSRVEASSSEEKYLRYLYTSLYTIYAMMIDVTDQPYYTPYNSNRLLTIGSSDFWWYIDGYSRCEWDLARQVYAFLALIDPITFKDNINTIQAQFNRDGKFYCDWRTFIGSGGGMPAEYLGHHATLAFLLGIPSSAYGIDYNKLLISIKTHLTNYTNEFWTYGYNPTDGPMTANQTSRSLEQYATLKGIGIFAKLMGDTLSYQNYYPYYKKYTNLWRADLLQFYGKTKNGSWSNSGFFEGDGISYRFMVPQDPYGILELHGVDNAVNLIKSYTRVHDYNDYKLNYEYLPIFADRADVTQDLVKNVHLPRFMDGYYTIYEGLWPTNGMNGQGAFYTGNAGALAASILGLWYTHTSGGTYLITAPSVDSYVIHGMKDLTVNVNKATTNSQYISSIKLDGENYPCYQLSAKTLGSDSHTLTINLVEQPTRLGAIYLSSTDGEVLSCGGDLETYLNFIIDPMADTCIAKVYSVVRPTLITLNGAELTNWSYDSYNKLVTLNVTKGSYHIIIEGATQPPGSFNLLSPPNGSVGVSLTPILTWTASERALSYTLIVDDQNDFSSPIFNKNIGDFTSQKLTGLKNLTTYYWKVIAHNPYGDVLASNCSFSFTTIAPAQNIEAESMNLKNYFVNDNSSASNGKLIKLSASGVTGNATYNFTGNSDVYDIRVWYYDENDGACTFNIYVGGVKISSWVANQNLGSADPVTVTRTNKIISGITINKGDQIKLEAIQNSQEWGRYDLIEIYIHGYEPPSVSITSPLNNAIFHEGDNITITTNVIATCGIAKVEFYQGNTKLGESTTSPYTFTWNNVSAGSYALKAIVTDNCGVTISSSIVNVIVTSSQGTIVINITKPTSGATLQNVVDVNAKVYDTRFGTSDGSGISEVIFYLLKGSTVVQSHQELTSSYDWSLDVAGLASGDYMLKVIAYSNLGDSAVSQINVNVIGNPRPPGSWVLTFSDEFNGIGSPDPTKWDRPEYNRRNNNSGPDGWWSQEDSYLDGNGNLVIRIRKIPNKNADNDPYDYSVGAVRTYGKFTQKYGKFEVRAKLPTQPGWWVAFWMMQGNQGSIGNGGIDGSEVDIMEAFGWTNKINHAIHWDGYGSEHKSVSTSSYPPNIRDGFHIYTLIWDPDMYYFYIDSIEVWRTIGGGVCNQPGYIKITGEISTESWAIDRSWSNNPTNANYPDYFLIDWVRVYEDQAWV